MTTMCLLFSCLVREWTVYACLRPLLGHGLDINTLDGRLCCFTPTLPWLRSLCLYVCMSQCLSVCLSAHITQKSHVTPLRKFSVHVNYGGGSDNYAIHYLVSILWMTSCFRIMGTMGQNQRRRYVLSSSSTWSCWLLLAFSNVIFRSWTAVDKVSTDSAPRGPFVIAFLV